MARSEFILRHAAAVSRTLGTEIAGPRCKKGTFAAAYPLSPQRSDGRKSGGNTARDARAATRGTWLSVARGTRGSPAVVCTTKKIKNGSGHRRLKGVPAYARLSGRTTPGVPGSPLLDGQDRPRPASPQGIWWCYCGAIRVALPGGNLRNGADGDFPEIGINTGDFAMVRIVAPRRGCFRMD